MEITAGPCFFSLSDHRVCKTKNNIKTSNIILRNTGEILFTEIRTYPEAGISQNYSATNSGSPEVELRPVHGSYCSNNELGGLT
jgi:hypothetical protein